MNNYYTMSGLDSLFSKRTVPEIHSYRNAIRNIRKNVKTKKQKIEAIKKQTEYMNLLWNAGSTSNYHISIFTDTFNPLESFTGKDVDIVWNALNLPYTKSKSSILGNMKLIYGALKYLDFAKDPTESEADADADASEDDVEVVSERKQKEKTPEPVEEKKAEPVEEKKAEPAEPVEEKEEKNEDVDVELSVEPDESDHEMSEEEDQKQELISSEHESDDEIVEQMMEEKITNRKGERRNPYRRKKRLSDQIESESESFEFERQGKEDVEEERANVESSLYVMKLQPLDAEDFEGRTAEEDYQDEVGNWTRSTKRGPDDLLVVRDKKGNIRFKKIVNIKKGREKEVSKFPGGPKLLKKLKINIPESDEESESENKKRRPVRRTGRKRRVRRLG